MGQFHHRNRSSSLPSELQAILCVGTVSWDGTTMHSWICLVYKYCSSCMWQRSLLREQCPFAVYSNYLMSGHRQFLMRSSHDKDLWGTMPFAMYSPYLMLEGWETYYSLGVLQFTAKFPLLCIALLWCLNKLPIPCQLLLYSTILVSSLKTKSIIVKKNPRGHQNKPLTATISTQLYVCYHGNHCTSTNLFYNVHVATVSSHLKG